MNILLQVDAVQTAVALTSYGPLGIVTFLCISVIIYLEKIRNKRDAERDKQMQDLQEKLNKLEERIDKLQSEDRAKMLEVIQHNSDIMEEVVAILNKSRI